jgi:signal transduction histidine kinase
VPRRVGVAVASTIAGTVAARMLLDEPGIQATVIGSASGSAGAVVATLTAYLFVRRMHRTLSLADAMLGAALTLLPVVSAIAAVTPAVRDAATTGISQFATSTCAGMVAAVGLVAVAVARAHVFRSVTATDRAYVTMVAAGAMVVIAATLLVDRAFGPTGASANGALIALHVVTAVAAGAASVSFFRASAPERDPVIAWLGVAAAFVAAAHLTDALLAWPSAATPSGGNLVHLAGWLALLIGGVRDFEWAQRRNTEDAVLDERRRLARELHDGLAQELAYITTESRRLAGHSGAAHLAEAAERALEESRAAICALTRPVDEPLERTITVAAQSLGARAGIDVTVAVRPGLVVPADVREALLRILREAMTNAARHGRARTVRVSVDGPGPLVIAIADDGIGFDPVAAYRPDSFGVQSMRERALNLGGSLTIESVPRVGTTVAVVLP